MQTFSNGFQFALGFIDRGFIGCFRKREYRRLDFGVADPSALANIAWTKDANGNFTSVKQYQPSPSTGSITKIVLWPAETVDGIPYPVGDPGFSGGGALASALLQTNGVANNEYIGYLGINDATTVGTAHWLTFNGTPKPPLPLTAAGIA
jgi:hypothetical protein